MTFKTFRISGFCVFAYKFFLTLTTPLKRTVKKLKKYFQLFLMCDMCPTRDGCRLRPTPNLHMKCTTMALPVLWTRGGCEGCAYQ